MPPRDRRRPPAEHRKPGRPEIDRAWLWRGLLVVVVIALVLLIAKAAMMAFGGVKRRLDAPPQASVRVAQDANGRIDRLR